MIERDRSLKSVKGLMQRRSLDCERPIAHLPGLLQQERTSRYTLFELLPPGSGRHLRRYCEQLTRNPTGKLFREKKTITAGE